MVFFLLLTYGRFFTTLLVQTAHFQLTHISKITKNVYWFMGVFKDLIFKLIGLY